MRYVVYPRGKVGEDIPLACTFEDSEGDALELSACSISIRNIDGVLAPEDVWAALITANRASYTWSTTVAGRYVVEWHAVYGDGIDIRSPDIIIDIDAKVGTALDFAASEADAESPLGYFHLEGTYTVPSESVAGELVAITAALVASTYATRAAGGPVAADAVIVSKLTDTTARLAVLATLDSFSGLTPGSPLYLSTAGAVTHTQSTADGEVDQCVGLAISATKAIIWVFDRAETSNPTASNKAMAASLTSANYQEACATAITSTPNANGYVAVLIDGVQQEVGDGVRTKDCYFSVDAGTTARAIADIAAGDKLYWVGSVAGFQLATSMKVDFNHNV